MNGISPENAAYIENNTLSDLDTQIQPAEEEYTPPLFADENNEVEENTFEKEDAENQTENLLNLDNNEEEDFEIPAFLRKQKF